MAWISRSGSGGAEARRADLSPARGQNALVGTVANPVVSGLLDKRGTGSSGPGPQRDRDRCASKNPFEFIGSKPGPTLFQDVQNALTGLTTQFHDKSGDVGACHRSCPLVFAIIAHHRRGGTEILSVNVQGAFVVDPGVKEPLILAVDLGTKHNLSRHDAQRTVDRRELFPRCRRSAGQMRRQHFPRLRPAWTLLGWERATDQSGEERRQDDNAVLKGLLPPCTQAQQTLKAGALLQAGVEVGILG